MQYSNAQWGQLRRLQARGFQPYQLASAGQRAVEIMSFPFIEVGSHDPRIMVREPGDPTTLRETRCRYLRPVKPVEH